MMLACALLLLVLGLCAQSHSAVFQELSEPICPSVDSSIYTVRCELQSESTASTRWIINGVTCSLPHTLASQHTMEPCGPGSVRLVTSDTDTEGSYASEFRFIPVQDVNGLEVECFATSNQDFVYSDRVKIVGSPSAATINNFTLDDIQSNWDNSSAMVTISWELDSDTAEVSRYVVQVTPSTSDCPDEGCVLRRGNVGFFNRTLDLQLPVEHVYAVTVSSESSCDTVVGARSDPFQFNLNVPEAVESCNSTVIFSRNNILTAIKLNFSRFAETPDIARGVPGLTHYIVAVNDVSHALAETDCHPERCLYQKRNFKRGDLVERLSVLAENAIGLSDVTTCIPASQTIGYSNNLLSVHVDVVGKKAVCTFPSNWRGYVCSLTLAGATYTGSIVDGDDNVTIDLTNLNMGLHDDYRLKYFATATDGQLTVSVDGVVTGNGSSSGLSTKLGIAVGFVLLFVLVVVIIRVLVLRVVVMMKVKKEKGKRTSKQDEDHPRDAENDGPNNTTPTAKTFLKGSDGSAPIAHAVTENGDHGPDWIHPQMLRTNSSPPRKRGGAEHARGRR